MSEIKLYKMKDLIDKLRLNLIGSEWWQKSKVIKPLGKKLYWNLPRFLRESKLTQEAVKAVTSKELVTFLQIGANDGVHWDPLYKYVRSRMWRGLMVEPNPPVFQLLKENHSHSKSQLTFENVAVGDAGSFTLYWCSEDPGMASTNKAHVIKHSIGNNWIIKETEISMITFESLLEKYPQFKKVDILLIDTEGWDGKILLSINFSDFDADLLIFEKTHISADEYGFVKQRLEKANYTMGVSGWDCVAIKNNVSNKKLEQTRKRMGKL
jgi:FkbM family methyltransferase